MNKLHTNQWQERSSHMGLAVNIVIEHISMVVKIDDLHVGTIAKVTPDKRKTHRNIKLMIAKKRKASSSR